MSSSARKREKHRLKREKKKREMRRAESVSPFRRAAYSTAALQCYVTAGWQENGLADFIVVGQLPNGMLTLSGFAVDIWCVGLKDAWGRAQLTRGELEERVLEPWRERVEKIEQPDAAVVRKYVAGAIRFSRQNGFRLPEHWQRYTAILGDLGPIDSADLSEFGIDGGLRYVGTLEFLRKRLIGCTVDAFLNRPDVKYITDADAVDLEDSFGDEDWDDNEEMSDEDAEAEKTTQVTLSLVAVALANEVRRRRMENGQSVAQMLNEGALVFFAALTNVESAGENLTAEQTRRRFWKEAHGILTNLPQRTLLETLRAVEQIFEFYKSFPSSREFLDAFLPGADSAPDRIVDGELVSERAAPPLEYASPPEASGA